MAAGAVLLGGRWRLLDDAYMGSILECLLATCVEQGWLGSTGAGDIDGDGDGNVGGGQADAGGAPGGWEVPVAGALDALAADFDPRLVAHCLRVYGDLKDCTGGDDGTSSGGNAAGALPPARATAQPDREAVYVLRADKVRASPVYFCHFLPCFGRPWAPGHCLDTSWKTQT